MNSIKPEEFKELVKEKEIIEEIKFEQLTENSLKEINELQKIFPNWTRESSIKKIRSTIRGKDFRFVVKKNEEIIAHVKFLKKKSIHEHIAEMTSLIVNSSERRKGIATKLINFSIEKLPKKIKLITLAVDSKNKNAINLYKKIGFKKYGLLKKGSKIREKYVNNCLMVKEVNKN
ncbi:MAG: GNAT family N-acetyltransferase [Candidatus ainarchaeum sp.]|nr:GNAT family N-acetyltransferase [Candidatus ainarchaeum sp.]